MKDLTIQYAGQTITYSEILCTGFRISDRYSELAAIAASEYMREYYETYGNFQSFAERGFQDGYKLLDEYLNDTIKDLVSRGIYDTNRTRILNEYGTALFGGWMDLEESVTKLCADIEAGVETERQMRELRKASRGRMVGGGFGVKGAVKGMATAGLFNATTGAIHSARNAVGNAMTRSKTQRQLQELYDSKDFRLGVRDCIQTCVLNMGYLVEEALGLNIPKEEFTSKATALRENFRQVPKEKQPEVAAEILKLAPDSDETYKLLLPIYGDPDGELYRLVGKLAPSHRYRFEKLREELFSQAMKPIYEDIKKGVKGMTDKELFGPVTTDLKNSTSERVLACAKRLGYQPDNKIVVAELKATKEKIVELCKERDVLTKTVNGVTYQNRKLAQAAAENRKTAEELWRLCEKAGHDDVLDALRMVRELNEAEPAHSVDDYVQSLLEKERAFRTVDGDMYQTYEIAEKVRTNRQAAKALSQSCAKLEPGKRLGVLKQLKDLNHAEPTGSVSDIIDGVLVKYYGRKTTNGKEFRYVTYSSIEARQDVECDFYWFVGRNLPKDPTIPQVEAALAALQKAALSPASEKALADYLSRLGESIHTSQVSERNGRLSNVVAILFGMFSLFALVFLALVKVNGVPCSLMDLIGIVSAESSDDSWSIFLVVIYGICAILILKSVFSAIRVATDGITLSIRVVCANVFAFCLCVGGIALIGGDTYSCTVLFFVLVVSSIMGMVAQV